MKRKTNNLIRNTALLSMLALLTLSLPSCSDNSKSENCSHVENESTSSETTANSDASLDITDASRGFIIDKNDKIMVYTLGSERFIEDEYISLANILDKDANYGLDNLLEDILRIQNPTRFVVKNTGNYIGISTRLTLDSDLSLQCYNYLKNHDLTGSISIVNEDGSIIAMSSYSEDTVMNIDESVTTEESLCNLCLKPETPGSIIKILSGVIAESTGFTSNDYIDPGYISDLEISNWDAHSSPYETPKERSLSYAILYSSNCYFAELFRNTEKDIISCILNKYFSYDNLHSDFITLKNTMNLDSESDKARAGFGQRNKVSPLYMAACANAVVTNTMYKPYIVDSMVDTVNWEELTKTMYPEIVSQIPEELTVNVKQGMRMVADDIGLTASGYTVYAKTGTAERGSGMNDIHYILSTLTSDSENQTFSITLQIYNSQNKYASGDVDYAQGIIDLAINR